MAPHFGPASLDFHLNRPVISLIQLQNIENTPVISLIQLHIVSPGHPSWNCAPIWLVPEPPLRRVKYLLVSDNQLRIQVADVKGQGCARYPRPYP